jgi:hypothetical protein
MSPSGFDLFSWGLTGGSVYHHAAAAMANGCYAIRFVLLLDGTEIRWHFFQDRQRASKKCQRT